MPTPRTKRCPFQPFTHDCGGHQVALQPQSLHLLTEYQFLGLISALRTTLSLHHRYTCQHLSLYCSFDCSWGIQLQESSLSWSELLLCVLTAGLFEQGQAGQHLGHRQFSVDFVVPRAHIDAVSHLLLLSDHCQDTRRHNSLTWAKSHHTHTHTATLTHSPALRRWIQQLWVVSQLEGLLVRRSECLFGLIIILMVYCFSFNLHL